MRLYYILVGFIMLCYWTKSNEGRDMNHMMVQICNGFGCFCLWRGGCSLHAIVKGEMKEKSKKPPSTTTLFCVKKFTWIWHPKQRMKGQYLSSSISQNILTTFSGTPLVPFVPFLLKLKQNMASCLSTLTSPSSVSFFLLDSGSIYSTYIPILFINH